MYRRYQRYRQDDSTAACTDLRAPQPSPTDLLLKATSLPTLGKQFPATSIQLSARMNMPDQSVLGNARDRQTADALGDGQYVTSVRQAAEALFKPTIGAPRLTDEPSHRKPRILPVSPAVPARAEGETPATPPTKQQFGSEGDDPTEIPESHYGRVRVLAKYGMTLRQVAELYAVPLSEVLRIVRM
jgi:hypothetical protein